MSSVVEIEAARRDILLPLFKDSRYDRVLIDSVLAGFFGCAYADSEMHPAVARLDSGAFTMLAGDAGAAQVTDLLRLTPVYFVTPETVRWRRVIEEAFGERISTLPFTDFSSASLDPAHLATLTQTLPADFELRRIDASLAKRLPADTGNNYFFENFHSIDDILERGVGYCAICQGRIVSAATSMASSRQAIDIEIETVPAFQTRGIGTAVGAQLVLHCVERGIEPRWLAANPASEKLALKLGYTRGETYETLAVDTEN